jgi:hypothetical protein
MAGDDISYPDRLVKIAAAYAADETLMLVTTEVRNVDEQGRPFPINLGRPGPRLRPWLDDQGRLRRRAAAGAAASYRKEPGDILRGRCRRTRAGTTSAISSGRCCSAIARFLPEPLMDYRQHAANLFNYAIGGMSEDEFRKRDLRHLAAHAAFPVQWRRDLECARRGGRIGPFRHWLLSGGSASTAAGRF